jgi:ABC-2 type transport system ATP-binding protein
MNVLAAKDLRLPAAAPALMEICGLAKTYGDQQVLAGISFSVQSGEILALIGPNGAGKTTLLESIAGLLPIDSGDVIWRGTPLPAMRRRQFMFYLPDGLRPWDGQYVVQILEFFGAIYARSDGDVSEVARTTGLVSVLCKRVTELSKGYARRLMLALALLTPHPLLLMDEPFDGFDLRQARGVMDLFRQVAAGGRTLVLAIHQLADAERIADRYVLLAEGRLRGAGTLHELRARASCPKGSLEDVFLALT